MTRKSRFISAIAIAASGALMITTTAYQSKAANGVLGDNYHIDEGTGYAGAKIDEVTTESSGTFRYDAPGTGEDIKIVGNDITALASAVNALASQVMNVGDTAKAADMALDTGAATAIGNASEANTTALANIKASIDALSGTNVTGGGTGGKITYGEIIKTDFGYANIDQKFTMPGNAVGDVFSNTAYLGYAYGFAYPKTASGDAGAHNVVQEKNYSVVHMGDVPLKYVVWESTSGPLTAEQLKSTAPWGRFAYAFNNNGQTQTSVIDYNHAGTVFVNAYVIRRDGFGLDRFKDYTKVANTYAQTSYYYTFVPLVD